VFSVDNKYFMLDSTGQLAACFCLAYSSILKTETIFYSETSDSPNYMALQTTILYFKSFITSCSPLNVQQRFGGTCLHLQQVLPATCWFLAWRTLQPWRWRRRVPLKRQLAFNGLHGVISQVLFITSENLKYYQVQVLVCLPNWVSLFLERDYPGKVIMW
jgi:hypothetical protein